MDHLKSTIGSEVGLRLLLCPLNSNIVTRAACCTVGIVLPVYSTLRAIEKKDQQQQHKWLLYWTAYGSFSLVEIFSDKVLSWFRPYYYFKFTFLVWLQLPNVEGAKQIYMNHLRPIFLKHQTIFDQLMGITYVQMVKFFNTHQEQIQYARAMIMMIVKILSPVADKTSKPSEHNEAEDQTNDLSDVSDLDSDLEN